MSKKAFSLIEIIVALGVLSVLIGSVLAIFPQSIFMNRVSREYTLASNLAQEKMESFASLQYEEIGVGILEPRQRLSQNPSDPLYIFEREVEVSYVNSNLEPVAEDTGLKKIRVSVYFQERGEKDVTLYTLVAKK